MEQKNVVITGASRGIGYELVKYFSKNGHQVLALTRNRQRIDRLQKEYYNIAALEVEITRDTDLEAVEAFVKKTWKKIDIVIHNAGKLIHKPFFKTSVNDFIEVYKVNVFAVAALTQKLIPFMGKGGHIVTLSSIGGIQGSVKFPGLAAYSSSKGAVITLMELLAEEYKETGIAFNTLALGAVQTEMLERAFPDYKAPVSAAEMADFIAKFALEAQKVMNGKVVQVSSSTP